MGQPRAGTEGGQPSKEQATGSSLQDVQCSPDRKAGKPEECSRDREKASQPEVFPLPGFLFPVHCLVIIHFTRVSPLGTKSSSRVEAASYFYWKDLAQCQAHSRCPVIELVT